MSGLSPGNHGFHVHETSISGTDCDSTGPHYNPTGTDHGDIHDHNHHAGDLGNIFADQDGNSDITLTSDTLRISGENSVIGRSIVVHRDEDDLGDGTDEESLRNGNSGPRIGCCNIVSS